MIQFFEKKNKTKLKLIILETCVDMSPIFE